MKRVTIVLVLLTACLFAGFIKYSNQLEIFEPIVDNEEQQFSSVYNNLAEDIIIAGDFNNCVQAYQRGYLIWENDIEGVARDIEVDGDKVFIGAENGKIYIYDLLTGENIRIIDIQYRIYEIDLLSDRQEIAVTAGSSSMNHKLIKVSYDGEQLYKVDVGVTAKTVAFNPETNQTLVGTNRGEILFYDLEGNKVDKIRLKNQIEMIHVSDDIQVLSQGGNLTRFDHDANYLSNYVLNQSDCNVFAKAGHSNEAVYIVGSENGYLGFYNSSGEEITSKDIGSEVVAVAASDEDIVIATLGGQLIRTGSDLVEGVNLAYILVNPLRILLIVSSVLTVLAMLMTIGAVRVWAMNLIQLIIQHRTAYILLIPTFLLIIIFAYIPIVTAFIRAFTDWNMFSDEIHFNGLENFRKMITEGYFLAGSKNLMIMIVVNLIKFTTVPFIVAELVYHMKHDKMKYYFRLLYVVPMIVPMVVTALMWQNIYDPNIGLLNELLELVGLENFQRVWLGDPDTALGSILFMGFPFIDAFAFLVFYGGLLAIPKDLFEAAKIDGSSGLHNLIYIHLPLVAPQFKIIIILQFINTIQNFAPILILTGGGPGVSTYVPGLELYYNATVFGNYGYACALGVVMFVFIGIVTFFNMRIKTYLDA